MDTYTNSSFQELPDNRLDGETEIRQAQLVMLGLLKNLDIICKKHNLTYWLEGGTLLGAVRHKGFIPWDDDLDVMMPREDFNKLLELPDSEFPQYIYHDKRVEFQRLRDRYSRREDEFCNADEAFNSIYIDIFPVKKFHYMRKVLSRLRMCIPPYTPPSIKNAKTVKSRLRRILAATLYYFLTYSGLQFIIKLLCYLGPKNVWSYDLERTWHYHFNDKWLFPLKTLKFEDAYFPVPNNYHEWLKYNFGDYMTPKPDNHHNNIRILVTTPCRHPEARNWFDDFPETFTNTTSKGFNQ